MAGARRLRSATACTVSISRIFPSHIARIVSVNENHISLTNSSRPLELHQRVGESDGRVNRTQARDNDSYVARPYPYEIILTTANVDSFPNFKKGLDEGKVVADKTGRLRYLHGAPVGKMIFVREAKDGTPIYRESAEEWFSPGSPMAAAFKWPE